MGGCRRSGRGRGDFVGDGGAGERGRLVRRGIGHHLEEARWDSTAKSSAPLPGKPGWVTQAGMASSETFSVQVFWRRGERHHFPRMSSPVRLLRGEENDRGAW